jgi:Reverse transcriptase (RNA-dependent DNA polymerase)
MCILTVLNQYIVKGDLQFGFTAGKGCQKALLVMSSVTEYFNERDSNVYVAGLDVSKAFDSVNHFGVFVKLMDVNVPVCVLNTLVTWYSKLSACVRWAGVLSQQFDMHSGVREGSVISPLLFSLYINDLIDVLKSEGLGCYLGDIYAGCLLFADDILLLSASLLQLQCMLDACYHYCCYWDLKLNVLKSNVIVFGGGSNIMLPDMLLGAGVLEWVKEVKYLGVYVFDRNGLKVNVDHNCRKFLGASFSILQRFGYFPETVLCKLILTKCLPILTYGMECFALLSEQRRKLSVAFNTVIRRIFKLSRYTSVRDIIIIVGSKPCDVLVDERRVLQLLTCLKGDCDVIRICGRLLCNSRDLMRIFMKYDVHFTLSAGLVKLQFYRFLQL